MALDKKELRKEQHRLEILQIAERVFARQGFHATTMEEIAEECAWSKGTLYLYFKSKEDLFFSVLLEKMEQFSSSLMTDLASSVGIEEKISALIIAQFRFFTGDKDFFQLVIAEQGKVMHGSSTGMREKLLHQQQTQIDDISAVLDVDLPDTSSIEASTLAASIIGAVNIHLLNWLMAPDTVDLDEIKHQITELFLSGILQHENN